MVASAPIDPYVQEAVAGTNGRLYRSLIHRLTRYPIPSLPLPYRFTGLFAGEGFRGVIGLTNRTHTDYERLIEQVEKYTKASAEC